MLFEQLSIGAARCRLILERDRVVDVELVDRNRAFDRLRFALPQLLELLTHVRALGTSDTLTLRIGDSALRATAHPVGHDHAMVTLEDVTARDQLERRARDSQGRFEQAFHGNAAAMVIAHQSDLRILDVNPRWLELFGATRDEVIGRTSVELGLITEAAAARRIAQHRRFADGYDIELELRTRAGASLTVLASAKPIHIPEGPCTLTTLIDITGRKHAEEAFAVAFSASPAGMMLVEVGSDTVVAVNNRMLEIRRDRREALVGRQLRDLTVVASPAREVLLDEIERVGRLDGVEVELACTDGTRVSALASAEIVTLSGRPHRLSVFTDITVRKRHERRLLTQHGVGRNLAEHAELEAAIPQALATLGRGEGWDWAAAWLPGADGALTCHGTWHDASVSDELSRAVQRVGVAPDGLLARVLATSTAEKVVLDPAHCGKGGLTTAAGLTIAVAFPILRGEAVLGVVALAARAGDRELDTAELGLFDSVGRLLGLFVERARAEAAVRELNVALEGRVRARTAALETSNRDLEAFSASVSHDLRAPLRAIHGFAEILRDDFAAELPDEAAELLARIHASASRLRGLIEELLAFARLGRSDLRRIPVAVDPLVEAVIAELLAGRALGDRVHLALHPLGTCHGDPSLLRAVWTNLIDNALKYAQHRPRIEIEIGCAPRGDEVAYYVRDNGVGFDMAHADRLFGVFQRLHTAAEFEGTGIGLANVRRIVERHHGRVTATSELGQGSRFEFTLGPEPT